MNNRIVPDRMGVMDLMDQVDQPDRRTLSWLRPLHDRVLVRRDSALGETVSGIVIPEVGREKPLKGTVIAVGPGKKDADGVFRETMVRPGDVVLFSASVNVPYPDIFQNGELVMMAEADILGILTLR